MKTITLKSSDDEIFDVKETIANQSEVIRKMLEINESSSSSPSSPSSDSKSDSITIPLPNVKGRLLSMVIEWITKHVDEQIPEEDLRIWETEFVNVDLNLIYEIILAADYLEVSGLFHRGCQKVADIIAGKSPEEIRRIFNIENDFSPEEEADLRRQNAWTFETDGTSGTSQ